MTSGSDRRRKKSPSWSTLPGAMLHVGDMHARQGDGEICGGGGIETGGVVKLMVELGPKPSEMTWPRIENDTHIMTTGQGKPAEDAFRIALSKTDPVAGSRPT